MEQEEFIRLIAQDGAAVYGFCTKLTGSKAEAEDLYQDVCMTAYEKRKQIDAFQNPKSFLMSIAVGIWKNCRRKAARRQRIAPLWKPTADEFTDDPVWDQVADDGELPEDKLLRQEEEQLIQSVVAGLPDKLRLPVYLYYTTELSVGEIGRILRVPPGTVKSRLHRAKQVVREELEERGYEV